ncbi:hypothetical protein SAMN05216302_1009105 [Nitrosomonas aestuarii]|uniref:Amidohydrolase family protein n=1 Tax=Nitrosomonas aestuarii TaxID=52441 RepID=A0A1I4APJ3_9PROT|nr:hypothetical protein [Nitrosomonas aestuarii]SFK57586.1 hypothetical protein SAMN05216302_1009105 [Nitrosomonas aestuarii]
MQKKIDLGDATILPGFIESHAHISVQNISSETVLRHSVTTVRDTGGPLHKPLGGDGKLHMRNKQNQNLFMALKPVMTMCLGESMDKNWD